MLCSATLQGENTFTQTMAILAWPRRKIMLIATVVVITVAVVLLAAEFMGGEKKIKQRIERVFSLEDPRFTHELGVFAGTAVCHWKFAQSLAQRRPDFPTYAGCYPQCQKIHQL